MGVIVSLIIGFFVGLIARWVTPGKDRMGIVLTSLLGVGGAYVGSALGRAFGFYDYGESAGFLGAVTGAVVIILVIRAVRTH